MRKLIFAVCFLLVGAPARATMLPYMLGGPVISGAPADHCSACTVADADILCEDFENGGTGPACTVCGVAPCWTINDDGDGSVTFEAHPAAITTCTDEGSYAIKIVHTASSVDQFAEYNVNGDLEVVYIQGWFYIEAEGLADEGKFVIIGGNDSSEANQSFYVYIEQEDDGGAHVVLSVQYWDAAEAFGGNDEGTTTVTTGTWHRIIVKYDAGDALQVWLDEDADASPEIDIGAAALGGATYQVSYVYFGSYQDSEESHTIWWDNIKIDDDTAPGDCS